MKKFIISILKSIFFVGFYLAIQAIVTNLLISFSMKNNNYYENSVNNNYENFIINEIGIALAISILITFAVLFLFYKFSKRGLLERCRFKKFKIEYLLYIIMIIVGFSLINSLIVSILSNYVSSYQQTNDLISNMESTMLTIFVVNLMGPIFEEILFRGVIFDELRESSPIYIAIIIQAIIFGFAHGNLLQGCYTAFLAIVLAIINYCTKSLWSDIIGHILFNLLGGLLIPILFSYSKSIYLISIIGGFILFILGGYLLLKRSRVNNI